MAREPNARTLKDREAWAVAAWEWIAARGDLALSIEGIAPTLGVTKGSFYWHFADRRELLLEVLAFFEQKGANEPIAQLAVVPDARRRITLLFELAFEQSRDLRAERCLYASGDADVRATVLRVHSLRRAFLDRAYRDLGLPKAAASRWSATAYATYLGAVQLSDQPPFDDDKTLRAWVKHVATALVPVE